MHISLHASLTSLLTEPGGRVRERSRGGEVLLGRDCIALRLGKRGARGGRNKGRDPTVADLNKSFLPQNQIFGSNCEPGRRDSIPSKVESHGKLESGGDTAGSGRAGRRSGEEKRAHAKPSKSRSSGRPTAQIETSPISTPIFLG